MTLPALRDAQFNRWESAADEWARLSTALDQGGSTAASTVAGPLLATGWAGADADAAFRQLEAQDTALRAAAQEACGVAPLVEAAVSELRSAQAVLTALLAEAAQGGLAVGDDGAVRARACEPAHSADAEHAARISADIAAVLVRASEADELLGDGVRRLAADSVRPGLDAMADAAADSAMVAALASVDASAIPKGGPQEVAAWWAGLSERDRRRYLAGCPEALGALDGLPAHVRDRANRLVLAAAEAGLGERLAAERAKLDAVTGGTRGAGVAFIQAVGDLETRLAAVRGLRASLDLIPDGKAAPPAYLLALSPDGDGTAVVALGDPDRARHTAVFVPGKGADLANVPRDVERMRALWSRTGSTDGDVAAIAWTGYDAPNTLQRALDPDYARTGAPKLGRFVDGLRAAHDATEPDHVTVIGHSYGSLVAGEAAKRGGLAADDIVAVGSPGMHVHNASQLGTAPGHVWVARAPGDPIPELGKATYTLPIAGVGPDDRAFGANRITTDGSHGHSEYWRTDHPDSLDNQAAIVKGEYDRVHLMWGTPPPGRE
ncbi:alpha/beta hydrolase [Yinghuangia seranimata]|uniref:alpha/beta hydrolase n=1 Tax=Yinghuangia seranimata TaxID=408067 RepID=UPI00248B021E|nr:alpha/beta hydrolase [Yinghuangia seranimata]MDI2131907.1 alpha/beta hydrolase [Yinghuangia seranimata]